MTTGRYNKLIAATFIVTPCTGLPLLSVTRPEIEESSGLAGWASIVRAGATWMGAIKDSVNSAIMREENFIFMPLPHFQSESVFCKRRESDFTLHAQAGKSFDPKPVIIIGLFLVHCQVEVAILGSQPIGRAACRPPAGSNISHARSPYNLTTVRRGRTASPRKTRRARAAPVGLHAVVGRISFVDMMTSII